MPLRQRRQETRRREGVREPRYFWLVRSRCGVSSGWHRNCNNARSMTRAAGPAGQCQGYLQPRRRVHLLILYGCIFSDEFWKGCICAKTPPPPFPCAVAIRYVPGTYSGSLFCLVSTSGGWMEINLELPPTPQSSSLHI